MARARQAAPTTADEMAVMVRLRRLRQQAALIIAIADLADLWSLHETLAALTIFADLMIEQALVAALWPALRDGQLKLTAQKRAPVVTDIAHCGLFVLGLGKLGSRELNFSSDVDLIFLFDERKVVAADGSDATPVMVRVVQRFVRLLNEVTEDGYVLRVDLRLRPDPSATPVALSCAAAEVYYHSMAHSWERAALIRARVVSGDVEAGELFLGSIERWLWRQSLDFTAIRDIHDLRQHMADHFGQEEVRARGLDIKRGPGGIREIEFLLQILQLIHGGRHPALRIADVLTALPAFVKAGYFSSAEGDMLARAYHFWRRLEHRLQMRHDAQTHLVPESVKERRAIAHLMGYATIREFERTLLAVAKPVHRLYQQRVGETASCAQVPTDAEELRRALAHVGLGAHAVIIIGRWRSGRYRALRTERARRVLEQLLPLLLRQLARVPECEAALARLDTMLESLSGGVAFLELLQGAPVLLKLLVDILSLAPSLGDQLARQPALIDAVLDADFYAPVPDRSALLAEAAALSSDAVDLALARLARWQAERRFQVGVQLMSGSIDGLSAARAYARIADAVVAPLAGLAEANFVTTHGSISGGALIVLAMGGWGGGTLAPHSDLDLVLLFTGRHDSMATVRSDITATHYYNRLGQRLIGWLTAPGPDGSMATVDTRLRPSGQQGLLAVTVESFASYQTSSAWTWEHLALARARVVYGPETAVMQACRQIFATQRDWLPLRHEILTMRSEMDQHRPPRGPFDFKMQPGGLTDIEFLIEALLLRNGLGPVPEIPEALSLLASVGALGAPQAARLTKAWQSLLSARVVLQLCAQGGATVAPLSPALRPILARAMGCRRPSAIEAQLATARRHILLAWQGVFGHQRST